LLWWATATSSIVAPARHLPSGWFTREPIMAVIGSGLHRRLDDALLDGCADVLRPSVAAPVRIRRGRPLGHRNDPSRGRQTTRAFSVATAFLLTVGSSRPCLPRAVAGRRREAGDALAADGDAGTPCAFMGVGLIQLTQGNVIADAVPSLGTWFGVIHFERLIFLIGSSLFIVLMARERAEQTWLAAASVIR